MDNNKKAFKAGIWYTVSNFFVKSIGFLTTPIFTRLLTKEEFGIYNNYLSWLALITIFITLNLESTLISARFDFEKKFDEYILSVLSLSIVSGIFWILIFNIFSLWFIELFDLSLIYINVMLLYLLFSPAISMFQAREQYYFEYRKTVIISLLLSISSTLLSVLLVIFMKDKLSGRIYGSVIPTIFLGIYFYFYFIRKGKRIKLKYWKYAFPICLPYIPHLLSMTLLNSTDRVMINKWCSSEDTAMYSLAYTVGAVITILLSSLNSAFAPWLGEKLNKERYKEIDKFSKIYMFIFLFFAIGVMLIAPEALYILGGSDYMAAKYVMTPVTMGCVCQFLYTMFVNIEQFKKKTSGMAFASFIAAFVNFGLNYLFIPKFGYLVAAYTTLIGYICLLLLHMFLVYRLKLNQIYNYKFVYFIVIIGMFFMVLITLLYQYRMVRYFCLICYIFSIIFMIIKKKEYFLEFLKGK